MRAIGVDVVCQHNTRRQNGSRRKRIARGSGTSVQEVNNLLRQYAQMRKMFKQIGKPSFARKLAGMKMPGM